MGGAVVSLMDARSRQCEVPHQSNLNYRERAARGAFMRSVGVSDGHSSDMYRLSEADDVEYARVSASYERTNFLRTLRQLVEERRDKHMVAYRPVNCVRKEETVDQRTGKTKRMDITYLRDTVKLSYGEVWERVEALGRGLAALGLQPRSSIAIYQETCLEWFISIYGIWSQGMIAATVYANLGEAALAYALQETEAAAIVCSANNAPNIVRLMSHGAIPSVPIVHVGALPVTMNTSGVLLYSFEEILELGRASVRDGTHAGVPASNNDELALIMYTSGTTGNPKGVMHTHGSLTCGVVSLMPRVQDILGPYEEGETYCCFLPMAHIMEFTLTNFFILRGALVGFGSPRTLMSTTARPCGDLQEFRPRFMVGVPRIFDTLKKAIEAKLPAPGSLKRRVYERAYQSRLTALKEGRDTPYWNEKVFAPIRAQLGGRVHAFLVGGGPASAATQEWMNVVLGPCVAGYGLTETVCVGVIQLRGDWETTVGGIIEPGEEIKLIDTEHYKHTDKPEPRGELLQRGRHLFKGYYKQPALTKEVIDEDGWFHTGDVVSITKEGKLRIVGRVKALAKNSLGEYIALETLEAIYSNNKLLQPNGVCVLVHPDKNYIAAIALTDEEKAMTFAQENSIAGQWPSILESAEFQAAATQSLIQTARDAKRADFECVRHVRVIRDEWTPENDVLTAALKLKRRSIDVRYAETIQELFADA